MYALKAICVLLLWNALAASLAISIGGQDVGLPTINFLQSCALITLLWLLQSPLLKVITDLKKQRDEKEKATLEYLKHKFYN